MPTPRRRSPFAALVAAALLGTFLASAQVSPAAPARRDSLPPDSTVQSLLDARAALAPNAGLVIGLLDARGRRVLAAGTLDGKGTPRPDARTVFEVGSVTKTFTGALLADMVRRGEVRLAQPVAELLPDTVKVPTRSGKAITLEDLATQSSGLPRLPGNFAPKDMANPYADYSPELMFAFLKSYELTRDPGAEYEYTNLGMGLLGFALARHAGESYEALVRERISGPLGMKDTRVTLTPDERKRLAPGHDADGEKVANWDLPTLAGAGALRSTAEDMLTYLAAALRADSSTGVGHDLVVATTPRRATTIPDTRIGLAWHVREANGTRIVWHNGGTGGYHTFVAFAPDRGLGLVVLGNSTVNTDDIGFHLLDPSVPLAPPQPRVVHHAIALAPEKLRDFVGRYELAPGAVITVTQDGSQLSAQLTGQPAFPIYPESDSQFFLKVVEATVSFERDSLDRVTRLVLHQGGHDTPGRRMEGN